MLFAEGKESTVISVSDTRNTVGSPQDSSARTYSEANTFFSKDISDLLQNSVSSNILQDGTIGPQSHDVYPYDKPHAFVEPGSLLVINSPTSKC
jgi:hypothetical protein